MQSLVNSDSVQVTRRQFSEAEVVSVAPSEGMVRVRLTGDLGGRQVWAKIAAAAPSPAVEGDKVLVAGEDEDNLYVIGWLGARCSRDEPRRVVQTESGGYAAVERAGDSETLRVFSRRGDLVFEYDPESERARISAGAGELELSAGDLTLSAQGRVRIQGQSIEMTTRSLFRVSVVGAAGKLLSKMELGRESSHISCAKIGLTARRGEVDVVETKFRGRNIEAEVGRARWVIGKLERIAKTVIDRAKNVYRTVEQLSQLRAGRVRTRVESTYYVKSRRALLKSEEDFKIDGERIHLG